MAELKRRLIINSDDFARSFAINKAVEKAHREGILTTASLMVNEEACLHAVEIARRNPRLGVGLHLALCCGRSGTRAGGNLPLSPVTTGTRIFFSPNARAEAEAEIESQFEQFQATGLPLDHVNGHLNIHLHPTVLKILLRRSKEWNIKRIRLTNDPLSIDFRISNGAWLYRLSHWFIYKALSGNARGKLAKQHISHTDFVFGLLRNDRMDEDYLLRLLPLLPNGVHEIYCHPSVDTSLHELNALTSERVGKSVREGGFELVRYQDLS